MTLYHFEHARSEQQLQDMQQLQEAGICIFCPQHLRQEAGQRVLWESEHWILTPNKFPYSSARLHLLLVPHAHVTDVLDLPPAAQQDFWSALGHVRTYYELAYYGIGIRNGDPAHTGGTIAHVHVHVLVADPAADRSLRMRFSSGPVG
ncbi:MAG: HIT family protein [Jatrophihabitans sp.]